MGSGGYHERVTIQKPRADAEPDASGRIDLTNDANWEQHCVRQMKFLSHSGREFFQAKQVQADLVEIGEVYYDSETRDIDTTMRIKLREDRRLNISAAYNVEERNKLVRIHCVEAV